MVTVNHNYLKLPGSYLFSTIGKKVKAYKEANPQANVISLGIGDVTQPLAPAIIEALHKSVDEMGDEDRKVLSVDRAVDAGCERRYEVAVATDSETVAVDLRDLRIQKFVLQTWNFTIIVLTSDAVFVLGHSGARWQ